MRNRNMYYLTGLPGWMRFGYSPGWVGRSASGLGPGAEYMMTGQWPTPQMQMAWQAMQAGQPVGPYGMYGPNPAYGMPQPDPQAQLQFLQQQADMLAEELEAVRQQIAALDQSD